MKSAEDRLWDMLARWEELYRRGEDVAAESLCRDQPELLGELSARIESLKRMDWLLKRDNEPAIRREDLRRSSQQETPDARSAAATMERPNWIGQTLSGGRYQVLAELGEGGMGSVFQAQDHNLGTAVVIKVPRRSLLDDPDFAIRFQREIRSLVQLVHPHVVKIQDVGEHEGVPFAVMQYLAGGTLRGRLGPGPDGKPLPLAPGDLASWLEDVATALDFIHKQRIIHRDVKPENILFDVHGHAFLSDFGIAKVVADGRQQKQGSVATADGTVFGTPRYMAPELILGQPYDGRVDQYALAVTVYELFTGRYPIDGPNSAAIFVRQTTIEPERLSDVLPSIPSAVSSAVRRALSKSPHDRFPDCVSFARAVIEGSSGVNAKKRHSSTHTKKTAAKQRQPTIKRPRLFWLWTTVASALSLVAVLGVLLRVPTKAGTLLLNVNEAGAEVFVDNDRFTISFAHGEPVKIEVHEGTHDLKVTKGGFQTFTKQFILRAGETEIVTARLEPFPADKPRDPLPGPGEKSPKSSQLPTTERANPQPTILHQRTWTWTGAKESYASYNDLTFEVGMGDRPDGWGCADAGVEIENVRRISVKVDAPPIFRRLDDNSFAGFFLDYHTEGGYTKRVCLAIGMFSQKRQTKTPLWGKRQCPDEFVDLLRLYGKNKKYDLDLKLWAPPSWDDKVWFTVSVQNSGKGTYLDVSAIILGIETEKTAGSTDAKARESAP